MGTMSDKPLHFQNAIFDGTSIARKNQHLHHTTTSRNGVRRDIALNSCFLIFPMLLFTVALLFLVFKYQINPDPQLYSNLRIRSNDLAKDAFYVDTNSTFLIFLVSWMSSLAPMLVGCAISLATYPVAQKLLHDTLQQNRQNLLTSYQLSSVLRIINGSSWTGFWDSAKYQILRRKLKSAERHTLGFLTLITLISIFLT